MSQGRRDSERRARDKVLVSILGKPEGMCAHFQGGEGSLGKGARCLGREDPHNSWGPRKA